MGAELAACSTAFQLRKCGTKNPVYHKRSRKRQFKFPQSDKKRSLSKRKCVAETAIFTNQRVIQEMEQTPAKQLGTCPKLAGYG